MSSASTRTAYHPAGWSTVSGGLGVFNVSDGIELPGDYVTSSYAFNILQNRKMAHATEGIGAQCRSRKDCDAALLVGGLEWIAPWPYAWQSAGDMSAYLTRDMPVYELEGWNTTLDKSISWTESECRVFQADVSGIQICAKESNKGGTILTGEEPTCPTSTINTNVRTGIRACDLDGLNDEGDCSLNPEWPGWNTFVAFSSTLDIYRLNVSIAADRRTSTILEILDRSKPTLQDIRPNDFLDAFENFLCPFTRENGTVSRYCEVDQSRFVATASLWDVVYRSYTPEAFDTSLAVDTLRNLYAAALFLCNPLFRSTLALNGPVFSRKAQDGLPAENYFPGSAARQSTYIAPAPWTVLTFAVLAGFLIVASLAAISVSLWFKQPESSSFGLLDAFNVEVVPQPGNVGMTSLEMLLRGKNDEEAVQAAEGWRVKLKQG